MRNIALLTLMALAPLFVGNLFAGQDPVYPFKVKLDGQAAVKKGGQAIFATIDSAVPANAEIEVEATGQVIVNAFQCDAKGNPIQGKVPAVLIFQAPKGTLAQTLDGNPLQPGKYIANVVANGATSRVVFNIE